MTEAERPRPPSEAGPEELLRRLMDLMLGEQLAAEVYGRDRLRLPAGYPSLGGGVLRAVVR